MWRKGEKKETEKTIKIVMIYDTLLPSTAIIYSSHPVRGLFLMCELYLLSQDRVNST